MKFPLTICAFLLVGAAALALDLPTDEVAGIIRRPFLLGCPDGLCPAVKAPGVAVAALQAVKRPAAPAVPPVIPGAKVKAPEPVPPPPFPGPSSGPSRIVQIWDNGVVWERATNTWWWQDSAGAWYHQP